MNKHECLYTNCTNETTNPKYCSLKCGALQQNLDHPRKSKPITRQCQYENCDSNFQVERPSDPKKYCSRSCAAKTNNTKYIKRPSKSPILLCSYCQKKFRTFRPSSPQKFCSTKCANENRKETLINSWLNGEWDGNGKHGLSLAIRNYLLEEAGYRCQSPTCCVPGGWCEVNPSTGRVPLEVEHIDGDAYNNKRKNLIVLCPNCHSLTSTYRALNKNGTRKYRKNATV